MSYNQRDLTTFKPSASPLLRFETPIQQIVSSVSSREPAGATVIVRTAGRTALLDVSSKPNLPLRVACDEVASFTRADCGDRLIVDVAFNPLQDSMLLAVNDSGGVYRCDLGTGKPRM